MKKNSMEFPLLSVITPTYNCAEFIKRSYNCLCKQNFTRWEWVVVNDGSTDHSNTILSNLALSDTRIKVFTLDRNRGRGFARNFALSKCSTNGIVIWDVDDLYVPTRLRAIWDAFKSGFDFFCSYSLVTDTHLNLKGARHFYETSSPFLPSFVHPTLAFKKSVLGDIGYDHSMRAGEDLEIMLTLEKNFQGFYSKEYMMLYVEDREINLQKTISMHESHETSIRRLLKSGVVKLNFIEKFKVYAKLYFKHFILQLMRAAPSIYMHTVKLRHKDSINSKLLNSDHIKIFQEFSDVKL